MGIILSKPKPPHNYEAILKNADSPLDMTLSLKNLYPQLYNGIFLKHKTQKYWIDGEGKTNCFVLYARDLSISWAESQSNKYWSWFSDLDQTSSNVSIEVAKLENVTWLEVVGRFEMENLTPNRAYEVVFVVKLADTAKGWGILVNFKLVLPTGETKERRENLNLLEKNGWVEIPAGEFMTSPDNLSGMIEFSMFEKTGQWKSGLIVKGVAYTNNNKNTRFIIMIINVHET